MINRNSIYNPWKEEDEKEHFPCLMEWWAAEAFFNSKEDENKWNLKVAFTEWFENSKKIGSVSNITFVHTPAEIFWSLGLVALNAGASVTTLPVTSIFPPNVLVSFPFICVVIRHSM